eukprot:m.127490 g.127490  ORF g.127490 m.127490 type:complete len:51 (+) comp37929_c1_seq3:1048-1200(+)
MTAIPTELMDFNDALPKKRVLIHLNTRRKSSHGWVYVTTFDTKTGQPYLT